MSILEERLPYLETLQLEAGGHDAPNNGLVHACVMEAVAYLAGEEFSDRPQCASPVISAFLRTWNDLLSDEDRQMLKPFIPKLVGTKASKRVEEKRTWMATDWLAREYAPAFLRLAGLNVAAETLEELAPLTSNAKAIAAQPILSAAESAAWSAAESARSAAVSAAWSAAVSAARSAAVSAALLAAWSVAESAAGLAAWSAAESAAWSAAWSAARSAAGSAALLAAGLALDPTVKSLQASALLLVERMIEAK